MAFYFCIGIEAFKKRNRFLTQIFYVYQKQCWRSGPFFTGSQLWLPLKRARLWLPFLLISLTLTGPPVIIFDWLRLPLKRPCFQLRLSNSHQKSFKWSAPAPPKKSWLSNTGQKSLKWTALAPSNKAWLPAPARQHWSEIFQMNGSSSL